ncbi:MAG: sulfite exporter TauE/SafE family protein [Caldimonas sp.]
MTDFPLVTVVAAALVVTLAYTVFGLTGFGAVVVGLPLLVFWLPIRFAVPMMAIFDVCASLLLGLRNRRDVDRRELLRLAPFAAAGMLLGVSALVLVPERWLMAVLGTFVAGYASWSLLSPNEVRPIAAPWAMPTGIVGGAFSALYGTGGPIYTIYLARRLPDPKRLRASIGTLIFFSAWARFALFSGTGLLFQPSLLRLAAVLLPFAIAGYFIGSHLHGRLAPRHTARAVWTLLLASGVSLLWRAWTIA